MGFLIKSPPEFTTDVPQWNRETFADGEEMAKTPEVLLNNDVYLKAGLDRLTGIALKNITISVDDWEGLTYVISGSEFMQNSQVKVSFDFDSILAAQKANIRGRVGPGTLTLVAAKIPVSDLVIEEIHIVNAEGV